MESKGHSVESELLEQSPVRIATLDALFSIKESGCHPDGIVRLYFPKRLKVADASCFIFMDRVAISELHPANMTIKVSKKVISGEYFCMHLC